MKTSERTLEQANELIDRLYATLESLMTNPSLSLEDTVYEVREREGLGWEGPDVVAWSEAASSAKKLLAEKGE